MADSVGQTIPEQQAANAGASAATFGTDPAAGSDLLVPIVDASGGGYSFTVSDNNGNTYNTNDQAEQTNGVVNVLIFRAHNITVGSPSGLQITVTPSNNINFFCWGAIEVQGLASSPLDKTAAVTNGNPGLTISSGTLSQADEFLIAVYSVDSGANPDGFTGPGSPWTSFFKETNGASFSVGQVVYQLVEATTTQSATWSGGSGNNGVAMMNTYKAAGGGGGATAHLLTSLGVGGKRAVFGDLFGTWSRKRRRPRLPGKRVWKSKGGLYVAGG